MQKKEHGRPKKENKEVKLTSFSGSDASAKALASVVKVFKKKQTLEKSTIPKAEKKVFC
jgi:hypothetical protein